MQEYKNMRKRAIGTLTAVLFFMINVGLAQEPQATADAEFVQLQRVLKANDTVIVTLMNGTETKGQLTEISSDRIVLRLENGNSSNFPASQITRVQRKKNGILLGALIGLGASAPFAAVANEYANNEASNGGGAAAIIIGAGTGLGIGIDALISRPHTVYKRRTGPGITMRPVMNRNGVGLKVALAF
jgi:hypothetical protein